ncbi:hypothetical protein [Paraburkholderia sp. BR14320]|uniref:hypothetical protein n=1 Tax=unclassified Paraburkholderia TaxID=2615204 RepID=UPI0034CEF6EA
MVEDTNLSLLLQALTGNQPVANNLNSLFSLGSGLRPSAPANPVPLNSLIALSGLPCFRPRGFIGCPIGPLSGNASSGFIGISR